MNISIFFFSLFSSHLFFPFFSSRLSPFSCLSPFPLLSLSFSLDPSFTLSLLLVLALALSYSRFLALTLHHLVNFQFSCQFVSQNFHFPSFFFAPRQLFSSLFTITLCCVLFFPTFRVFFCSPTNFQRQVFHHFQKLKPYIFLHFQFLCPDFFYQISTSYFPVLTICFPFDCPSCAHSRLSLG